MQTSQTFPQLTKGGKKKGGGTSVTGPSETGSARTPLQQLIDRAEAASARMGANNPNRALLADLSVALVSMAQYAAMAAQKEAEREQSRIVIP